MMKKYILLILLCLFYTLSSNPSYASMPKGNIQLGIDVLVNDYPELLKGKQVGLITNQSGVNGKLESTIDVLNSLSGATVTALFGPEHGIRGALYAGEKVTTAIDEKTGIPVFSLYGKNHSPTPKMLEKVDVLVFDIQDIGSRTYTYVWTMTESMKSAAAKGIPFVVLDRPNPINGLVVEGNIVQKGFESFIGKYPVAYCHGMTLGEMARMINQEYAIHCDLKVIPMKGWHRWMNWKETGLQWVPTSPHIPEADTPWYYPTTGIFGELKTLNEGIGYTLPFKLAGSPYIDAELLANELNSENLPGVYFQPIYYQPFYGPQASQYCQGVRIVITDFTTYQPVNTGYYLLAAVQRLFPKAIDWEGKAAKRWGSFDKANGTDQIRKALQQGKSAKEIIHSWQKELDAFKLIRVKYLIYD